MDFISHRADLQPTFARSGESRASLDRRDDSRMVAAGSISIAWHHDHESPQIYPALDVSEHGARIEVTCSMPEGLTGRVISHQPSGTRIDRPAMVVWCRAVRDDRGLLRHYEAGVRFF